MNSKIKKLKNNLFDVLKKTESYTDLKLQIALAVVCIAVVLFVVNSRNNHNDVVASSVAITNIAGSSGGTGIILNSSETHSEILTNSHVCKVIEKGGVVKGTAGSFIVSTYAHSKSHDLCLITVEGNLRAHTKVAQKAPLSFYENALISGHPGLMPNVVTRGHFSGRRVIAVMKGMKPCTDAQKTDPGTSLPCLLTGGIPDVVRYDATLVTATIMPGSSGSGVYDANEELAGVAFAGQGELGYAWTVPFESMKNFLNIESKSLEPQRPDNSLSAAELGGNSKSVEESEMITKLKEACESPNKAKMKDICSLLDSDMVWFK